MRTRWPRSLRHQSDRIARMEYGMTNTVLRADLGAVPGAWRDTPSVSTPGTPVPGSRCDSCAVAHGKEEPPRVASLVSSVARAAETSRTHQASDPRQTACQKRVASLTKRQREVLATVISGHPSKRIAAELAISQRTVEHHRASIMVRTGSALMPALTELVTLATCDTTVVSA